MQSLGPAANGAPGDTARRASDVISLAIDMIPPSEELVPGVRIAPGGLGFSFSRSSGPGGQAVNKLSTRAELRIFVRDLIGMDEAAADRLRQFAGKRLTRDDEIVLHADTHRSQHDNREACIERLRELVKRAMIRPKVRRKTRPSRGARERRLQSKRIASEKKSQRRRPRED